MFPFGITSLILSWTPLRILTCWGTEKQLSSSLVTNFHSSFNEKLITAEFQYLLESCPLFPHFCGLGLPKSFSLWLPFAQWIVGLPGRPGLLGAGTPAPPTPFYLHTSYLGIGLGCCQDSHLLLPAVSQQSAAISNSLRSHTLETTQQTQKNFWEFQRMADLFPSSSCSEKPHTHLPRTLKRLPVYTRPCKPGRSYAFHGICNLSFWSALLETRFGQMLSD